MKLNELVKLFLSSQEAISKNSRISDELKNNPQLVVDIINNRQGLFGAFGIRLMVDFTFGTTGSSVSSEKGKFHIWVELGNAIKYIGLGMPINMKDDDNGWTLLHLAAADGRDSHELVKSLLIAGADPNIKNDKGETVLQVAHSSVKELLKQYGAQ